MKSNNIIMGVLVAVVAVMGVAFAAFSTTLSINGTASISSTWKVTFAAGTCSNTTQKDSEKASTGTVSVSGTIATITANMASPGDVLTCTITAKNEGTLPAIRKSWSVTTAVTDSTSYKVETTAPTAATLAAKNGTTVASETLTVKITYNNVTAKPSSSATFKAVATYAQAI